jgi:hypothetical protein
MIITVINLTSGKISDEEVQVVIRSINRQIDEDFEPYWSFGGKFHQQAVRTITGRYARRCNPLSVG